MRRFVTWLGVVIELGCGHVPVGRVLVPVDDNPFGRDAALACIRACAASTRSEGEAWAACLAECPAAAEEELACPGPGSSSHAACAVIEVPVDTAAEVGEIALAVVEALAPDAPSTSTHRGPTGRPASGAPRPGEPRVHRRRK